MSVAAKESQEFNSQYDYQGTSSSEDEKEETSDCKKIGEGMIKSTGGNFFTYSIEIDEARRMLRLQSKINSHSIELPLE